MTWQKDRIHVELTEIIAYLAKQMFLHMLSFSIAGLSCKTF